MAEQIIPGVQVTLVPTTENLNIPISTAEVCFIGVGKTTISVNNEVVTKSADNHEGLNVESGRTVASLASKIWDEKQNQYILGTDYKLDSANPNAVTWIEGGNAPTAGTKYTVSYEINKIDSDYDFKSFYNMSDIINAYGEISTVNTISLASYLYFLNGGKKINIVQVKPVSGNITYAGFTDALNKITLKTVDVVVPLFTNSTGFETLFSDLKAHVYQLSQPSEGKNRIAMVCPVDTTTFDGYKQLGSSLGSSRMVLTYPSTINIGINGTIYSVSGMYLNAAMSGILGNPDIKISEPLTRKELSGIYEVPTTILRTQIEELIENGVLVVETSSMQTIRVVYGITTDTSSTNNMEVSLVRIGDFFIKLLKNILDKMFIGTVIDQGTFSSIEGTIRQIVESLTKSNVLMGYSNLSIAKDSQNPTKINISLRITPVYPLNYIDVKFSIGL